MAALMIPVVGEYSFGFAQHVGQRNNPFSIVSSRCLSLAPCTTSVATTRIPKWSYSSTLREAILSPVRRFTYAAFLRPTGPATPPPRSRHCQS
jgi:hypothetical protein